MKGKGEREIYTQKNAKLQRTARRDKKVYLYEQCKEIEKNNKMGKTRGLFKKIEDIKGTFHAKMGTINEKISKELTETEEIKKRQQEYKKNYRRKILMIQITTMVWSLILITDILECEVK